MDIRRTLTALAVTISVAFGAAAGEREGRVSAGVGILYERGLDVTLGYEHEGGYHNAWEFYGNAYLKWKKCDDCRKVCMDSFWKDYYTWSVGAAYKPCVRRGRNHHGNLRIGGALGSNTRDFIGTVNLGYEHNYVLRHGWMLFWQVKCDVVIGAGDLFRTGVVMGLKIPT